MSYVELHCHSNYSFKEGASTIGELVSRARGLGYPALALTDHDNLCGAMEFARTCHSMGIKPITGVEITLIGRYHITLLAENREGYANICRLLSRSHVLNERSYPEIDPRVFEDHSQGIIALSGCRKGELSSLVMEGRLSEARNLASRYEEWFGANNYFIELQENLVHGDTQRNRYLTALARDLNIPVVATNNAHYHLRERHCLQDCLVAIQKNKSLNETHQERRPNSEFHLKSEKDMIDLFAGLPVAVGNTLSIAERCTFDLTQDLGYRFPTYSVPDGYTSQTYLEHLCRDAALERYGAWIPKVYDRLREELLLIERHDLAGFFLLYHEVIQLAREIQLELGLVQPGTPLIESPPGRGRGSSVAMLVGYLIGLSHIDPLKYDLTLERFLSNDLGSVPDIDLDFPRNIREQLILRVHEKYGWDHAVLTGMINTYKTKGAVRDLGKALDLPREQLDRISKQIEYTGNHDLKQDINTLSEFKGKVNSRGWRNLMALVCEIDGFPKYLAQHPSGMIISSTPLSDLMPIQKSAIEGRYVCHWDKETIEYIGAIKIDFLALGALSQMEEALHLIEDNSGHKIDISRINFEDTMVYQMLSEADTIGVFQIESAAQIQTIVRIKPQNLMDMAHEVGAVRPGVGANDGVRHYINRRQGRESVTYDHPLEKRALARTYGVILFQDQINHVAMDVAGFSAVEADRLRRTFTQRNNAGLVGNFWEKFRLGAAKQGVDEGTASRIFAKFNGQYTFPESHAVAFGVTAYQMAWLKFYYPLEFYVSIFNQQPMGFYNLETLKEDARRHDIQVLNPDINFSDAKCVIEGGALRLGFLSVYSVGPSGAETIIQARKQRESFTSISDFILSTWMSRESLENLAESGAFDTLNKDRRAVVWEIGLFHKSVGRQMALNIPQEQDMVKLPELSGWDVMEREYQVMDLHPSSHILSYFRPHLGSAVSTSRDILSIEDGVDVIVAGLVIRRQRPLGKAVFITLEDEFGHTPLIVWPKLYEDLRNKLSNPLLLIKGRVSRREGTMNIVVLDVKVLHGPRQIWRQRNWS